MASEQRELDLTGVTLLGVYRVDVRIAKGGMGTIWLAENTTLGMPVAVKVPSPELAADEVWRRRFGQEIRALTQFSHPNVVRILAAGEHAGVPYYVLEYLDGGSLETRIGNPPARQAAAEVVGWLTPVANALDHLHASGLLHRDVKPANVLFRSSGHPVLSDFGIVKALAEPGAKTTTSSHVFTPTYAAPEQISGEFDPRLAGRIDQYALAATAFEALTGAPAFQGNLGQVMAAKFGGDAPDARTACPALTPAMAKVLRRALERDPAQRFESCGRFARALAEAAAPAPPRSRAAAAGVPSRRAHAANRQGDSSAVAVVPEAASAAPQAASDARRAPAPRRWPNARAGWFIALAVVAGVLLLLSSPWSQRTPHRGADVPPEISAEVASASTPPSPPSATPVPGATSVEASPSAPEEHAVAPPPQVADTTPPELEMLAPSEPEITTIAAEVAFSGRVTDASAAEVLLDGRRVEVLPDGTFHGSVALGVDEVREVRILARDVVGNESLSQAFRLQRKPAPPAWLDALAEAAAAVASDDGEGARAALARAEAAGVPLSEAKSAVEFLRLWDLPPSVRILSPASGATVTAEPGTPFRFRVLGELVSGRAGDRLRVQDLDVEPPSDRDRSVPFPFQVWLQVEDAGKATIPVRAVGRDGPRAEAQLELVLEHLAPQAPPPPQPKQANPPLRGSPDGDAVPAPAAALPTRYDLAALQEVNRIRAERGLGPIRFESRLFAAAYAHSREQIQGDYLGHGAKDPARATLGQRMQAEGYTGRMYAEVVARDYIDARSVVQAWMGSPRHRDVLLDPDLAEGAIARVDGSVAGLNRWTGDFAAPARTSVPATGGPRVVAPPVPQPSGGGGR